MAKPNPVQATQSSLSVVVAVLVGLLAGGAVAVAVLSGDAQVLKAVGGGGVAFVGATTLVL